jgi:hypothetical protein
MSSIAYFCFSGLLLATNLIMWIVTGSAISALAVGFIAGLMLSMATNIYFDRKINREIMEEINTLTRQYDNQMSMNFGENNDK